MGISEIAHQEIPLFIVLWLLRLTTFTIFFLISKEISAMI